MWSLLLPPDGQANARLPLMADDRGILLWKRKQPRHPWTFTTRQSWQGTL